MLKSILSKIKKNKFISFIILSIVALACASYYFNVIHFYSDKMTYNYAKLYSNLTTTSKTTKSSNTSNVDTNNDNTIGVGAEKDLLSSVADSAYTAVNNGISAIKDTSIIGDKVIKIVERTNHIIYYNCNKKSFNYIYFKTQPTPLMNNEENTEIINHNLSKEIISQCGFNKDEQRLLKNTSTFNHDKFTKGYGIHPKLLEHNSDNKYTHSVSNLVPVYKTDASSGSLWSYIDTVLECWQGNRYKYSSVEIFSGNIWNSSFEYDEIFVKQNGIHTPESLFKIIIVDDKDVYSWVIKNSHAVPLSLEGDSQSTISEIEKLSGITFDIKNDLKNKESKELPSLKQCK